SDQKSGSALRPALAAGHGQRKDILLEELQAEPVPSLQDPRAPNAAGTGRRRLDRRALEEQRARRLPAFLDRDVVEPDPAGMIAEKTVENDRLHRLESRDQDRKS